MKSIKYVLPNLLCWCNQVQLLLPCYPCSEWLRLCCSDCWLTILSITVPVVHIIPSCRRLHSSTYVQVFYVLIDQWLYSSTREFKLFRRRSTNSAATLGFADVMRTYWYTASWLGNHMRKDSVKESVRTVIRIQAAFGRRDAQPRYIGWQWGTYLNGCRRCLWVEGEHRRK